jgi:hypothetical protein
LALNFYVSSKNPEHAATDFFVNFSFALAVKWKAEANRGDAVWLWQKNIHPFLRKIRSTHHRQFSPNRRRQRLGMRLMTLALKLALSEEIKLDH